MKSPAENAEDAEVIEMTIDQITGMIVDAAVRIHKEFGPGLLESVYEKILTAELESRGLKVECQKSLSLTYAGRTFPEAYRVDMLVEGCVILELKSTVQMLPVYPKQLRTYLVLSNLEVGLLLNFGLNTMKEGIIRVVNNYKPKTSTPSASSALSAGEKNATSPSASSALSAGEKNATSPSASSALSAGERKF